MGVKSLWSLLNPVGRPVELDNVEGMAMAIDSSIWIYQFQATMRDKDGRVLVNAHLVGFLRRILKLLFYGIKPVFVFDGGAPALKRTTITERKKKKEGASESFGRVAEKLLAAQMRREALDQATGGRVRPKKREEEVVLDENTVYLEDIQSGRIPTGPPVEPTRTASSEAVKKKSKYHDHDPYKLPQVDVEAVSNRSNNAPDPRLASKDELQDFIEDMRPEDFDATSPEFRQLPVEVQYEIIGDLRLKSRQTSHARLRKMLKQAVTPLDFSKQQIVNLQQRNALTQQLLVHGLGLDPDHPMVAPTRIASERNRQYVLVKNEGPNGGWVLGINDSGSLNNPIMIDVDSSAKEEAAAAAESEDEEMEEVQIHDTTPLDSDLREYYQENALRRRTSTPKAQPLFDHSGVDLDEDDDDAELARAVHASMERSEPETPTRITESEDFSASHDDHIIRSSSAEKSHRKRQPSIHGIRAPDESDSDSSEDEGDAGYSDRLGTALSIAGAARPSPTKTPSNPRAPHPPSELSQTPTSSTPPRSEASSVRQAASMARKEIPRSRPIAMPSRSTSSMGPPPVPRKTSTSKLPASIPASLPNSRPEPVMRSSAEGRLDHNDAHRLGTEDLDGMSDDDDMEEVVPPSVEPGGATPLDELTIPSEQLKAIAPTDDEGPDDMPAPRVGLKDLAVESPEDEMASQPLPDLDESTLLRMTPGVEGLPSLPLQNNPDEVDEDEPNADDALLEEDEFAKFISQVKGRDMDEVRREIEDEIKALTTQRKVAMRDSEDVTQQMATEIMMMLRLFGIPYITAPMEAEAQCAELVALGLVYGVITDDSDVFLFGGQRVFKNMFNQSKTVECFLLADLDRELGLDRGSLVRLAYLLGSDYTEGIRGVGPVMAMELLREFPGDDGLHKFKDWWAKVQSGKDKAEDTSSSFRKRFKKAHKDLYLPADWPNSVVSDAYYHPAVDSSEEPFKWGIPDLDSLRSFLNQNLGWGQSKVDDLLRPIIQRVSQRNTANAINRQSNLNSFLGVTAAQGIYAPRQKKAYESKRLQEIVTDYRRKKKAVDGQALTPTPDSPPAEDTEEPKKRRKSTKKKDGPPAKRKRKGKARARESEDEDEDDSQATFEGGSIDDAQPEPPKLRPRPKPKKKVIVDEEDDDDV